MIFDGDKKPERRITLRLLSYWEKLRKGRAMPREEDINPDDIADLWDYCFLVHTADMGKQGYNFTYLGKAVMKAYCGNLGPESGHGEFSPNAEKLIAHYNKVIDTQKPLIEEGEFTNLGNQVVKYRQCLVPLGKEGRVEAIFGGMRYKIF